MKFFIPFKKNVASCCRGIALVQVLAALATPSFAVAKTLSNKSYESKGVLQSSSALNQQILVSGTVVDSKGLTIPGVYITEKGEKNSVITDSNGNFKIPVKSESSVIIVSSIGFETETIAVSGKTNIKVILKESIEQLDQVVVVGYGTQKKSDLTGSVSSVKLNDTRSLPVPDAGLALQGRAAGVQVIASGKPGDNVTIRIRGASTTGNSSPLIVIDGVPTDLPLNAISPDDIETMDILKDASASAIYGSRGANGVVLITTKRGSANKGQLNFKVYSAIQRATSVPKMLNSQQFATLHNEMMTNNGQPLNPAYADPSSITTNTNWLGELFRTAGQQNYALSYSGGSDKSTFYVSGSYTDQDGIVINNGYKRYTTQVNVDSKVFSWLKFSNNLTLSLDKKQSGSIGIRDAMGALPLQPLKNPDGTWSGPEGQSNWYGDIRNPIGSALINDNQTNGYNVLGNISGEVTILPQLKFKTTVGLQTSFWDDKNWSPKYNWKPISNPFSTLSNSYNKSITHLWDNYFTYDAKVNKHHFTVLAGTSAQDNSFQYVSATSRDFISDYAQQISNGTTTLPSSGNASEWAMFGLLGRINYSYDNKYLLTVNVRRDASSRFGANYRWGTFPSASAKWRLSEESFFKKTDFLSDLALRAGYGVVGNQNSLGNYAYASTLSVGTATFNDVVVPSVVPDRLANPNIRWEEVEQTNLGVDADFFRGRINVTFDAYIKNTNDMQVPMIVPVTTGYSDINVPSINLGKVQNKGFEFAVTSQNLKGNINWSTSLNFSVNKNRIIKLNDNRTQLNGTTIQKEGYPINAFYGLIMNGLFQTQKEVNNYAKQQQGADPYNSTAPGDVRFLDLNNDGQINDFDRTFIGNPNPRLTFAVNNNFEWKKIDLSVFVQGIQGNDIYNGNRIFQEGMSVAQNQTTAVLNRWTGEGTSNIIPRAIYNDPNKNTRTSSRFVEDGSYLRIKNVILGYSLTKSLLNRTKISSARFFISAQNLVTFTNYSGIDPEVGVSGIDFGTYPLTQTFSAGINIGL